MSWSGISFPPRLGTAIGPGFNLRPGAINMVGVLGAVLAGFKQVVGTCRNGDRQDRG